MERDELAAWLRLALTQGVGNESARKLLAAFGPPQQIFEQSAVALQHVVTRAQAAALHVPPPLLASHLDATMHWLAATDPSGAQRQIVTLGDGSYPSSLLDIEDPPLLLFMQGRPSCRVVPSKSIAIVGSRNPTPQGKANARAFATAFREAGLTVVSGLALGIDGAAHEGAIDGATGLADQPATVAVVGTGLDRVYPAGHLALSRRIAEHGLIISEFLLGTPPLNPNFPKRNRIIAGLAQGTLVVEAALRSGSLITARQAAEQGKDVFAIPGSIHSPLSRGCHALIKQGAKLVESAQDVLEELHIPQAKAAAKNTAEKAAPPSNTLLEGLGFDPVSLDALVARTGMDISTLQARLMELELDQQVARLPGGLFQRMASV